MGKSLRAIKRGSKAPSPINQEMMLAWNRGYSAGSAEQRKSDIESVVKLLENLEQIEGIGEKTAWKIRKMFLDSFENKE
ncbi:hypothetical protein [Peribacillus asahii]|uniref:hypothetical protein n=1 Tax=Peribacillus asahii TaxID=228899 RepID=UPI003807438E